MSTRALGTGVPLLQGSWTSSNGMTGQSMVTLNFYLYGDQAAGTVARETPLWQAWIQERFPMPSETSKSE